MESSSWKFSVVISWVSLLKLSFAHAFAYMSRSHETVMLFVDEVSTMPGVNGALHNISAPSLLVPNAAEKNKAELILASAKPVTDQVVSASDKPAAVDDADDIVESSSPLKLDVNDDDVDVNLLSAGFAVPLALTSASSTSMIPAALLSLPSLMQLSRQALESRAQRSASTSEDEERSMKTPTSYSSASHTTAEMFSEDDEHNDCMAEITQVL